MLGIFQKHFLLLPSLHSLDSLYVQGKDLYIDSGATSATIINSESTMDIKGTTAKIVTCSGNSPCTASIGNVCSAASSDKGGVVCRLPECPLIVKGNNWNVRSESCKMSSRYVVGSTKTVKIKKDPSMSGELIIDRGSDTSGSINQHFYVTGGALELEDVTLKGGYTVSSFVLLYCCEIFTYNQYYVTDKI